MRCWRRNYVTTEKRETRKRDSERMIERVRVRWIEGGQRECRNRDKGIKAIELKIPGGKQSSKREKNRYEEQNEKKNWRTQ